MDIELSTTETEQLISSARYDTFYDGKAPWLKLLYVCSHRTLASCIRQLGNGCAACDTYSTVASSDSEVKVVRVTRFLGREKWFGDPKSAADSQPTRFSQQWYRQCRPVGDCRYPIARSFGLNDQPRITYIARRNMKVH